MKRVLLKEMYYLTESNKIQVLIEGQSLTFGNVTLEDKDAVLEQVRAHCRALDMILAVSKNLTIHSITARARARA